MAKVDDAQTEKDTRIIIATMISSRCINCFSKLHGYNVHAIGWNWITSNVGPLCDECFSEVKPLLKESNNESKT